MIKHIIFDLGNVLLDQKTVSADVYFASVLGISEMDSKTFYETYHGDAVKGSVSFVDLVSLYKENFKCDLSKEEIYTRYKQLYIHDVKSVNIALIELIKRLKINYSIYMMTNTLQPHFDHWKTLDINHYFNRLFRSDADHFIKPEKESYLYVVNKIGAKAEECIFVDDLAINVRGAKDAGLQGIVYQNNNLLKRDLLKFGVKI
ncbi:hypothetical protein COY90_02885 [Candidatus Roizmanbacteria bacterium CG_4_10_14_0_8_um_filter_39_9]|uniref:HAD family phosphatase n=1 Tax=Candidatus Roizmanbacteria bacterium CG_4_10_14_0_8_um_filter_39_9 TaxID=1974829 RepID=A0A2M7QCS0_9BACT|nr:MAG: hypothetical protein COY90_02885 [Candidatus Roizmanbacteria bacterium CG_4_10_14_0_8_um_filter_39_9]